MHPATRTSAMQLLGEVGAPARLRRHVELVGEAADALLNGFAQLGIALDADYVQVGVVLHDIGKTIHRLELDAPGSAHEAAGEALLLARGVSPELARVCRTHAQWGGPETTLEELVVALADKLWKGARVTELEERAIDRAARVTRRDRWALFTALDALFEEIAGSADARLGRSVP